MPNDGSWLRGESHGLYESLRAEPLKFEFMGDWAAEFRGLRTALQMRAQHMPDRFSSEILAQIVSSAMYLWLRLHLQMERHIRDLDEKNCYRREAQLSEGVVNVSMPRLMKLSEYIGEMTQMQAATARQWALTREILAQAEDAASHPPRKRRQRAKLTESQPAVDGQTDLPTNGTAATHPPATAISIGDRRVGAAANEGLVSYLLKLKNEMYGT